MVESEFLISPEAFGDPNIIANHFDIENREVPLAGETSLYVF